MNSIQKKTLNMWNDHSRYSYNKAVNLINNDDNYQGNYKNTNVIDNIYTNRDFLTEKEMKEFKNDNQTDKIIKEIIDKKTNIKIKKSNPNISYTKLELRDFITPEIKCSKIPWILETPKAVREHGVFEAHKNFKACQTNLSNGNIKRFNLRFKSKKKDTWSIGIPHASINVYNGYKSKYSEVGFYEDRTTFFRINTREKINFEIKNDSLVHFDGINYFLHIPRDKEVKKSNANGWFCALDPGVRKFQTLYSPDENEFIMFGDRASTRLYEILITMDNLISRYSRNPSNKLKLAIKKLRIKIENLQNEIHKKTINYLCNNYQNIYIPKLTKKNDIIKKKQRRLRTKTVRNMVLYGHCKFVEKLKTKAKEFTNVSVYVITEEYTSQKCLNCNKLTKTSNEIYRCNYCNYTIDRDILGSVNILLKNW